ncbi:hypothetical protein K2W90_04065 [Candidatus Babeliales bacterium]|nr:hypothetical protein [Candidatus Babeliales bacterium]
MIKLLAGVTIFFLVTATNFSSLSAHEPLFGFGPDTIRKGGYAIEGEFEYERVGDERETEVAADIMYGVTEYLAVSATIPFIINKQEQENGKCEAFRSAGLGKLEARAKYRLYFDYQYGKRTQVVLIGGIRFPTVGLNKNPALGNRTMDFIVSTAAGYETLQASYFGTITYTINTRGHGQQEGNELNLTLSAGFRPEPISYYKLDWLFFLEFDLVHTAKAKIHRSKDNNSGGYVAFVGPIVFVSKENILFKAGIQAPMFEHVNGMQEKHDYRVAFGLDLHF